MTVSLSLAFIEGRPSRCHWCSQRDDRLAVTGVHRETTVSLSLVFTERRPSHCHWRSWTCAARVRCGLTVVDTRAATMTCRCSCPSSTASCRRRRRRRPLSCDCPSQICCSYSTDYTPTASTSATRNKQMALDQRRYCERCRSLHFANSNLKP